MAIAPQHRPGASGRAGGRESYEADFYALKREIDGLKPSSSVRGTSTPTGSTGGASGGSGGGSTGTITLSGASGIFVNGKQVDSGSLFALSVGVSGLLKGDGTGISAATVSPSNTTGDYVGPADTRLSDARTPTGAAGGDLSGTYPNPTVAKIQGTSVDNTAPTNGQVLQYSSGAGKYVPTTLTGGGTVTSVSLAAPGIFTVSGSPVTTIGTITLSLATQAANTVFAGPTSGSAAAPTFRSLVTADFPLTGVTAGSYTNANITVDATGRVTAASNGSGGSVPSGTNTQTLRYNGTTLTATSSFTNDGTDQTSTGSIWVTGARNLTTLGGSTLGVMVGYQVISSVNYPTITWHNGNPGQLVTAYNNGGKLYIDQQVRPVEIRPQNAGAYFTASGTPGATGTNGGFTYEDGLVTGYTTPTPTTLEARSTVTTTSTISGPASSSTRIILIPVDCTSGNLTLTLPAASSAFSTTNFVIFTFKRINSGANTVTIVAGAGDTLEYGGFTPQLTTQNMSFEIIAYGPSQWWIR